MLKQKPTSRFETEVSSDLDADIVTPPGATAASVRVRLSSGARLKLTATIARQLQVLVGTGIPISQALQATVRQTVNPVHRKLLQRIADDVDEGATLSSAMAGSEIFDTVSVVLVAAGESSGNMPQMLERVADLQRRQLRLRSSVTAAMVYPMLLITMGFGVLLTMLLFVIPRFTVLFASLDSPLPMTTKMLMHASTALQNYWWAMLIGSGLIGAAAWYVVANSIGKTFIDRHYLNLPLIGPLGRSMLSSRVARMLGTMVESKVPLSDALDLTRRSAVNVEYMDLISRAESAVARGEPLSSILQGDNLLVPGVQEAIRNGEATGRMGQPLLQMAEFLDEENDVALKSLTSIIEPLILIGLGLVVGFIAMSIFLPMFDMISAAQGGA